MFEKNRGGMRRQTLLLASIVILLAMIASFTLAWFAQLLVSRGNRVEAGSAMGEFVELWAQSALPDANGGRYGTQFAPISFPTSPDAADVYLAPETYEDKLMLASYKQIQPGQLYKLVKAVPEGQDALVYGDKSKGEYNRLLDDEYLLPGKTITRRLIVRNLSDQSMSYTVSFADFAEDAAFQELSEAILVDTKRITAEAPNGKPDAALTGISAAQLKETTVSGELSGGKHDIYEMSFTFAGTATDYYAAKPLSLDVKVVANGGKTTHYISTEEELVKLLGADGGLKHGETIALNQDVTLHSDFVTDKMINLDLRGFTLKVEGIFLIDVTAAADYDPAQGFGTIDIAYDGNGKLLVGNGVTGDPKAVGIRAPKAAVRWIAKKGADGNYISTMPDRATNVDARVFNGKEARNPAAVMPSSTPVSGIAIDAGLNLTFLEADQTVNTLSFVATATKASADDQDPTFYATSTDESVAVVESVEQPYTPPVSAFGVGDPQAHARITLRRVSSDPAKSCKILVRAGSASAEVIVNIGVGVTSFTLPATGFVQPNPVSGPENEISITASGFLPANAVAETKTIVKWESSDKSVAIVIPDEADPNKAVVRAAISDTDYIRHGSQATIIAISLNGTRQSCLVTVGTKYETITIRNAADQESTVLMPTSFAGDAALKSAELHVQLNAATAARLQGLRSAESNVAEWSIVSGGEYISLDSTTGMTNTVRSTTAEYGKTAKISVTLNGMTDEMDVIVGYPATSMTATVSPANIWNTSGTASIAQWNGGAEPQPSLKSVKWEITDNPAPKGVSIDPDSGAVTVTDEARPGNIVHLKAVSVSNPDVTATASFQTGYAVTSITVTPPAAVPPGTSAKATAAIEPANASIQTVTWKLEGETEGSAAPEGLSIAADGTITAASDAPAGATFRVVATSQDGNNISGAASSVTWKAVSSVSLAANPATIYTATSANAAKTATVTATVLPADCTSREVSWSVSPASGATVSVQTSTLDSQGKASVTLIATVPGTYTVTGTIDGKSGTCTVTVIQQVTGVSLNATSWTATRGTSNVTKQLTATVAPANANNKAVAWKSSNTAVATVSDTGLVTAVGPGSATITVTTTDQGKTATCAVTVTQRVTGITVSGTNSGWSGTTAQLSATVSPTNANNKAVTWSTSNGNIASVSTTGLVTFGNTAGSATITATAQDGSGVKGTYSVTSKGVKPAVGDVYTYKGVKWVIANVSGDTFTLLYHDTPLDTMKWNKDNDNTKCEITAAGLRSNIQGKVPGSTLGTSDALFLPTTGNLGQTSGDGAGNVWSLFADNADATRQIYISNFSSNNITWTATPYSSNSNFVWFVYSNGAFNNTNALSLYGVVPALNVNL